MNGGAIYVSLGAFLDLNFCNFEYNLAGVQFTNFQIPVFLVFRVLF
jgi:hypothetical protein